MGWCLGDDGSGLKLNGSRCIVSKSSLRFVRVAPC